MVGTISEEREVKVPASEAWKLYGSLQLVGIVQDAVSNLIGKIDIHGDGTAGTILHLFFVPGVPGGLTSYKEKFTVVDDEKRVKVAQIVEGWYLDLGFSLFQVRFEVIDKGENECITKATIEYELKEEADANAASLVTIEPFVAVMESAAHHLLQNYNKEQ